MIHKLLTAISNRFHIENASAHCDIPCGIYDPIIAQIDALTVVRMIDLMIELEGKGGEKDKAYFNTLARHVTAKEDHAEKAKHEIRVIWGDYFKDKQIEKYPKAGELVHKILQLGSKARQTVDRDAALQFVEAINEFAAMFWDTKGVATKRAKAPYAPNLELVYPAL